MSAHKDTPRVEPGSDNHWLTRPATIHKLWLLFAAILATTVLAQFFIEMKPAFELDGTFAFGAWYGFLCCVAMVLAARAVGWWLKRPESYYDNEDPTKQVQGPEGDGDV